MITTTNELPRLGEALVRYQALTRKTPTDILAKEAREWAFALWQEFSKLSPSAESLVASARARNFAMGRRGDRLTPAQGGISLAAINRARGLLGGDASDYFRVQEKNGVPALKLVRFSKFERKGQRRLLIGGRYGNKFAAGSLSASQVEQRHLDAARAKGANLKRLNFRAVASAIEIGYRARAARGHLMGNQWLPQVYKGRKSALLKTGPLISRARNGKDIGRIDFATGQGGELTGVTLTAFVPGTERQAESHGIPAKVEAIRVADRMSYINRKLKENAEKALRK